MVLLGISLESILEARLVDAKNQATSQSPSLKLGHGPGVTKTPSTIITR